MIRWPSPVSRLGFVLFLLAVELEIHGAEIPEIQTDHMEAAVARLIDATQADLEKNTHSAKAWGQLGMVSHAHGLIRPAIDCYQQAAKLDPSDYRWPYLTATALRTSSKNEAIPHYAKAFELKPNDYALAIAYADTIFRDGQYQNAQDLYKVAIQIDDNQGFGLIGLARIAFIDNDLEAAQRHLQNAREIDARNREIYTLLAQDASDAVPEGPVRCGGSEHRGACPTGRPQGDHPRRSLSPRSTRLLEPAPVVRRDGR